MAISDFLSSMLEAVKFRVTTAIIATYVLFWAVFHWQGFYATLFVSQDHIMDKFGMLKNEYIETYFFGFHPGQWWYWLGFVVPAVLTWLFIWILPKNLFLRAFKQERAYRLERKFVILDHDREYEKKKASVVRLSAKRIEAEADAAEAEQKVIQADPTKGFNREYLAFKRRPGSRQALNDLKSCIYEHNGYIRLSGVASPSGNPYVMDPDALAIVHANELVDMVNGGSRGQRLELTAKGRYFLAQFA